MVFGDCFRICCGEGKEEEKFGAFVDPQEYGWNDEERSKRIQGTKQKIENVEKQISLRSKVRPKIRHTVYAKPIDINSDFEPPVFEKKDEERKFLEKALQDNFVFMDLSDGERGKFIDAMQRESVKKDTTIIKQGDTGDFFYIVQSGEVGFYDGDKFVGKCKGGGCFGELALLYDSPRAVSCIALSVHVTLWKVDQKTFRHLIARHTYEHEKGMKDVVRKIEIFKNLDETALTRFTDAMTHVHWREGDRIVQKGQEGAVFYIVQSGQVKIHDIGLGDSQYQDQILREGDWFGERALLTGEPRAANATALTEVTTLAMDRATFETCIGPLQNYMEKEMRKHFIESIPIFASSSITGPELDQLVNLMTEVCYREGDLLAEAGKPYTMNLWIIRHGRLLVYREKSGKMFNLQSGDYFGDHSIQGDPNHISSHNAICEENLTTWVLTRSDIESVVGDIGRLGELTDFVKSKKDESIGPNDLRKRRIIGVGGFGKVWLVSHKERPDSVYALKSMNKRQLLDSKQEESVLREKEFLGLLEHPFILHLISSFQDENHLYLVLPLVPGGELFGLLQNHKGDDCGLSSEWAAFYSACIIEALGHFHQRLICYRDLKLENVLIDAEGYCKIVDLGFAKVVTDKTYTLLGTPEYLAPEIIMSKGHDKAVDYWSYGVLVYELLCGESPFYMRGSKQMDMFKRIVRVQYFIPKYVDHLAKTLIQHLLVRIPAKRLGNLSRGYLDVKNHMWFNEMGIDFKNIIRKEAEAPWKPEIKDPFDSSNFHDYSTSEARSSKAGRRLNKKEQDLFKSF